MTSRLNSRLIGTGIGSHGIIDILVSIEMISKVYKLSFSFDWLSVKSKIPEFSLEMIYSWYKIRAGLGRTKTNDWWDYEKPKIVISDQVDPN